MVDIYRDAKRLGIYPSLFTDPEGDGCFSIYQIRWIKRCRFMATISSSETIAKRGAIFLSEYPRIFQVTGANQNAQKLLSTDLVNTKTTYLKGFFLENLWRHFIDEVKQKIWYQSC